MRAHEWECVRPFRYQCKICHVIASNVYSNGPHPTDLMIGSIEQDGSYVYNRVLTESSLVFEEFHDCGYMAIHHTHLE